MEEQNIVSIDLGTSKIGLTIARKEGKNAEVIYYGQTPSQGIARGSVQNVKKAACAIREAIDTAEETLHIKIVEAVVNMPKYPVTCKSNTSRMDRDGDTCVEEGDIETLRQNAIDSCQLDAPNGDKVLLAVSQSYSDEDTFMMSEDDIIGRTSSSIEGRYNLYIGKRKSMNMIDQAFKEAGKDCGLKMFQGESVSRVVLTEDEKNSGVALVDMGAGSTSVTIWKNGVLRWFDSIPFGGNLITKDIKELCGISENLAENIKKAYGACMPNRLYSLSEKLLQIREENGSGYELPVKQLSKIITARMEEIVDAVLYMIYQSGYANQLVAGIVITGGVSRTCNCNVLFHERSGLDVRKGAPRHIFTCEGMVDGIDGPGAGNSVGMMMIARDRNYVNCTAPADEEAKPEKPVETVADSPKTEAPVKDEESNVETNAHTEPDTDDVPTDIFGNPEPKPQPKPEAKQRPRTERTETKPQPKPKKGIKERMIDLFNNLTED